MPTQLDIRPISDQLDPDLQLLKQEEGRRAKGFGYRTLRTEQRVAFGQHDSAWAWFAMAVEPGGGGPTRDLPVVVWGVDIILPDADIAIGLAGPVDALPEAEIERILSSLRIDP